MNILLLSVGTRNKIVQYFKNELKHKGRVIAADMSKYAPALYEADNYYVVPSIRDEGYIDKIIQICEKENISGVLSLIDPELAILAEHKEKFLYIGVQVIGSDLKQCDLALNKWDMYLWLRKNNYNYAKSYIQIEKFEEDYKKGMINFPVIVKPFNGSASLGVYKVDDKELLKYLFKKYNHLMIQEYLKGQEIGIDCYVDLITNEVVSIFSKRKLVMRSGETDKSVSFKDEKLFEIIKKFVSEAGFKGPIDIDVFLCEGKYYISEVNPRFGGGFPHAYECGVNHMKFIINNLKNQSNVPCIGNYQSGIYMMKYGELIVK